MSYNNSNKLFYYTLNIDINNYIIIIFIFIKAIIVIEQIIIIFYLRYDLIYKTPKVQLFLSSCIINIYNKGKSILL